ncbi:hypothetical protein SAMN05216374_2667 [Tardiphaga sp. OK246]|uniref:hypothetical protein n=1 Tax=Tardiphaga sp. OK246 TaxID=1855307 RepID=UPI000B76307A|nr:hypothetical protein [Tardiphaga sp. OK246]SNT09760.1 hypothetical protein SAMN05216374_2667 [Tardiphaga sp. OK246]
MANPTPRADALRAMREAKFEAAQRLIKEVGKAAAPAESKPAPAVKKVAAAKPAGKPAVELLTVETQGSGPQAVELPPVEAPVAEAKPAKITAPKEKPAKAEAAKRAAKKTATKKSSAKKG